MRWIIRVVKTWSLESLSALFCNLGLISWTLHQGQGMLPETCPQKSFWRHGPASHGVWKDHRKKWKLSSKPVGFMGAMTLREPLDTLERVGRRITSAGLGHKHPPKYNQVLTQHMGNWISAFHFFRMFTEDTLPAPVGIDTLTSASWCRVMMPCKLPGNALDWAVFQTLNSRARSGFRQKILENLGKNCGTKHNIKIY